MASFYPFGRIKYSDYLQAEFFTRDITGAIKRAGDQSAKLSRAVAQSGEATRAAISDQTSVIVASNEALGRTFGRGFDAVNRTLEWGFDVVSQGLDSVHSSIEDLNATFSYNMGLVIAQMQVQNRLLLGVVERLDAIHKTLENPTLTQAREFYRTGCERLERGLLDKALEAFVKSEEKNDTDFLTQLQLGRLYLYGKDADDNVVDLEKARSHLLLAARFGKAEIAFLPDAVASTGEALLHASIACYLTASDAKLAGDEATSHKRLDESVRLALEAGELRPQLGEAHYQAASGLSLLARPDEAVMSLERAIAADRRYCLRAMNDPAFDPARGAAVGFFERLRADALTRAKDLLAARRSEIDSLVFIGGEAQMVREELESRLGKAAQMIAQGTLFDSQDAVLELGHVSIHRLAQGVRVLATLEGHTNVVNSVAFSPDGVLLASASGSRDEAVLLWDVRERRVLATLEGHANSVAFSPDGALLASGSRDKTVRLWDVRERRLLATLEGHTYEVESVAFSPDSTLLASGGRDQTVKLWDVRERRLLATLEGHTQWVFSVTFSPDGSLIASGSWDKTIKLWDVHKRRLLATLVGDGFLHSVAFSPDGSLLASSNLKLWDAQEQSVLFTLEGHTSPAHSIAFSPDGTLIAIGGSPKAVELWEVQFDIMQRAEWTRHEAARTAAAAAQEEQERKAREAAELQEQKARDAAELLKRRYEAEEAELEERKLQEERRSKGLCIRCGAKLGALQRLGGKELCKACAGREK